MRRFLIMLLAVLFVLPVAGCVNIFSGKSAFVNEVDFADSYNVFVASSRVKEENGSYGIERSLTLSYSEHQVSVPKLIRVGKFTYPQASNDPKRAYKILASSDINSANEFNRAVVNEAQNVRNVREAMVFVHGFKSNFEKSIFRVAKIDADFETPAVSVLYSWPSALKLGLYLHDMDSAVFARDGLEELLVNLANSKIEKITLIGHSMGASIVVETLRQMSFKGYRNSLNKIGGVALLSADISVDLFVEMVSDIDDLPQPFVIYSSKKDKVLRDFASIFHDGKQRLGNITDLSPLADLEVIVIDSSNIHDTSDSYHMAAAASPTMIALINSTPKVGFESFGAYAKSGKVDGAKIITDGALVTVELGGL